MDCYKIKLTRMHPQDFFYKSMVKFEAEVSKDKNIHYITKVKL